MEEYKTRIRTGFSTNAKGKAQLDITVEVLDQNDLALSEKLLLEAVQTVKRTLAEEGFSLAE